MSTVPPPQEERDWDSTNNCLILHCYVWNAETAIRVRGNHNKIISNSVGGIADAGCGIDILKGYYHGNYVCGNKLETFEPGHPDAPPNQQETGIGIRINNDANTIFSNYFDIREGNSIRWGDDGDSEDTRETIRRNNLVLSNFNRAHGKSHNLLDNELGAITCELAGFREKHPSDFQVEPDLGTLIWNGTNLCVYAPDGWRAVSTQPLNVE